MRIISDFRDYYDTAMGYGVDYDTIWLRKPKALKRGPGPGSHKSYSYRQTLELEYLTHTIGFCGKIYGCVVLKKPGLAGHGGEIGRDKTKICYTVEEIDEFVEKNYKKKQIEYYYGKAPAWGWRNYRLNMPTTRWAFVEFWKRIAEVHDKKEKFFLDNNSPVFVDNVINAKLKDLEFYRVLDPYTAFQEIQMFFGKLRSPEKPIPKISDSDMLEAKGFDPKWSFRKEPGTKKRKRKKK
jgi:hypothetical protein